MPRKCLGKTKEGKKCKLPPACNSKYCSKHIDQEDLLNDGEKYEDVSDQSDIENEVVEELKDMEISDVEIEENKQACRALGIENVKLAQKIDEIERENVKYKNELSTLRKNVEKLSLENSDLITTKNKVDEIQLENIKYKNELSTLRKSVEKLSLENIDLTTTKKKLETDYIALKKEVNKEGGIKGKKRNVNLKRKVLLQFYQTHKNDDCVVKACESRLEGLGFKSIPWQMKFVMLANEFEKLPTDQQDIFINSVKQEIQRV